MRPFKTALVISLAIALTAILVSCERKVTNEITNVVAEGNAKYVGSENCSACHSEINTAFMKSGHPYKLNKAVNARQPGYYPFGDLEGPPAGYTWDQVSYVIGGFRWKARFIDLNGKIITGDAGATTQWNLPTDDAPTSGWVPYHDGEDKNYDCGPCHMTAYSPDGNQDGLPGMIGTWALDGVQCEECHGPGEFHASDPETFAMKIERSNEQCGKCHIRGSIGTIPASGGFVRHHEQWNEVFTSKHASLDCIDCHDPHKGLHEDNPDRAAAIRSSCESCHFAEAGAYENSGLPHSGLDIACMECHMPKAAKSARKISDYKGDVRSHLFGINTDPDAEMFSDDGGNALGYLTLDFACLQCHITKSKEWAAASALAVHPTGSTGPGGPDEETPPEYTAANGFLGGAVYSKFWTTEAGGSGTEPTVPSSDFIRCKSCHAWDGLGNAASYANRTGQSTGKTSRPDVSSVNLRSTIAGSTIMELFDVVEHSWGRPLNAASNDMPSYHSALTTEQKWNLVKFMMEEWVEPAELYDLTVTGPPIYWDQHSGSAMAPTLEFSNIGKDGNAANGDALYAAKCAGCHGADGKAFTVGGKTGIGQFVRQKPHEAWFKVKFGESGTGMSPGGLITSTSDLKDLYKAVTNTVAYPD